MKLRLFGHACVLIDADRARVLIDPGTYTDSSAFDLSDVDMIAVTHPHPDHLDVQRIGDLLARNPTAVLAANAETLEMFPATAHAREVLVAGATREIGDLSIEAARAMHGMIHPDLPSVPNLALVVTDRAGMSVFHPGDSYVYAPVGRVDVLLLPLSAPWARLRETVDFVRSVLPRTVIPIHDRALTTQGYPVYWSTVERLGGADRAVRLEVGETFEVTRD